MTEIMARIGQNGDVELIDDRSAKIEAAGSMTPHDAVYLARGILSCATALSGPNPPKPGAIVGDAHLPVVKWTVGASTFTAEPVLILSVPSGIELTFAIWPQGAKELGAALLAQAQGSPLERQSGTVH
jgi:hypothetical protein